MDSFGHARADLFADKKPVASGEDVSMHRIEELTHVLAELQDSSGDIEACAVVSEDGLMMASSLPTGVEEARVAAMSAALLSIGARTGAELDRGAVEQVFVRGPRGYVVIVQAGAHAAMVGLARKEAKLGLLFLDLARAAEKAARILAA